MVNRVRHLEFYSAALWTVLLQRMLSNFYFNGSGHLSGRLSVFVRTVTTMNCFILRVKSRSLFSERRSLVNTNKRTSVITIDWQKWNKLFIPVNTQGSQLKRRFVECLVCPPLVHSSVHSDVNFSFVVVAQFQTSFSPAHRRIRRFHSGWGRRHYIQGKEYFQGLQRRQSGRCLV